VKNNIIKNIASTYLLSIVGIGLGFLIVPFLIAKLGREAYGLIVLAEATLVFFEIVTSSVRMALSRYSTVSLSLNKQSDFVVYLSTGRVLLFLSATIVLIAGTTISYFFTNLFNVPSAFHDSSRVLFFFITLAATISIPNIIFWSALYAQHRFDLINTSTSVGLVLRALCIFGYYSFVPREDASLIPYGIIYLAMSLTQNGMIYFFQRRLMPLVRFRLRYFQWDKIRQILLFAGHTAISRASITLYKDTATIIINIFWGSAMNAVFAIGMKLPTSFMRIFVEPSWVLAPTFTDLVARGEHKRFETLFFMSSKILAITAFPLCITLLVFAQPIITLWVGPDFSTAAMILRVSMAQVIIGVPFSLMGAIFLAYNKVKIPSLVSLAMGIVNVFLCLVLGVVMDLRLGGMMIAFFITGTVCGQLVFPAYACRMTGFSLKRCWVECFLKPFLTCCLVVGSGILFLISVESELKLNPLMVLVTILTTLIYYILSFRFLLNTDEKQHVRGLAQSALDKFAGKTSPKRPNRAKQPVIPVLDVT
jgi:membrane protein EpsK